MTRCDPRIVRCIREAASGMQQSNPSMARIALMLGLLCVRQHQFWPTQLGVEVARAMHGAC